MHQLKNKQTGVISDFTAEQFAELQKSPWLLERFDILTKAPAPPEVAKLKDEKANKGNGEAPQGVSK